MRIAGSYRHCGNLRKKRVKNRAEYGYRERPGDHATPGHYFEYEHRERSGFASHRGGGKAFAYG
jgi:hypothetical protein